LDILTFIIKIIKSLITFNLNKEEYDLGMIKAFFLFLTLVTVWGELFCLPCAPQILSPVDLIQNIDGDDHSSPPEVQLMGVFSSALSWGITLLLNSVLKKSYFHEFISSFSLQPWFSRLPPP